MAEIFLAKSLGTLGQQRLTVIKRVLPHLSADSQFSEMLVNEAKLCAQLNHRNIVQVTDLGRVSELIYIAMEYVEGFDLNGLLRRCTEGQTRLPSEFVFFILEETLRALDVAHRAVDDQGEPLGIIHRDVSPTNVLISYEGEVKLCDFGIAKATARDGALPDGVLRGKFAYMSPEQARGERIDQRSDLFAVGILLWELVAGHRLYRGETQEVLRLVQRGDTPPLPERALPRQEHLSAIVTKALAPESHLRYGSAREMLDDLGEYVKKGGLFASQLRFAQFLRDSFGDELRRRRELRRETGLSEAGRSSQPPEMAWERGDSWPPARPSPTPPGHQDLSSARHLGAVPDDQTGGPSSSTSRRSSSSPHAQGGAAHSPLAEAVVQSPDAPPLASEPVAQGRRHWTAALIFLGQVQNQWLRWAAVVVGLCLAASLVYFCQSQ
jgi:serine/threonine-protein kinase